MRSVLRRALKRPNRTREMCLIILRTILVLAVSVGLVTVSVSSSSSSATQYRADYEMPINVRDGSTPAEALYFAYIIEQGDLLIRKICTCVPKIKCLGRDSVQLAE